MDSCSEVYLSAIDEERFGIRVARTTEVTLQILPSIIDFCKKNAVQLLIARCSVFELRVAQAMEREGFLLMDTLVYYSRDLTKKPVPKDVGKAEWRPMRRGEEEKIRTVAAESFRGYLGHYYADERLDRAKCDEVYTSWTLRLCNSVEPTDSVLVAELDGSIVAFGAMRVNNTAEGEMVLAGVTPSARGKGIYNSLFINGMKWCLSRELSRIVSSTQITNLASLKVWTRLGFELSHAYYTFHKWFD